MNTHTKRKSEERRLQMAGVNWIKVALPNVIVIAVSNEQQSYGRTEEEKKTNMIRMKLLKDIGLYVGAADLFIYWSGGRKGLMNVIAAETKYDTDQSPKQKDFQKDWERIGGDYYVWRSLKQLHEICVSRGLKPLCQPSVTTLGSKKQLTQNLYHEMNMSFARQGKEEE